MQNTVGGEYEHPPGQEALALERLNALWAEPANTCAVLRQKARAHLVSTYHHRPSRMARTKNQPKIPIIRQSAHPKNGRWTKKLQTDAIDPITTPPSAADVIRLRLRLKLSAIVSSGRISPLTGLSLHRHNPKNLFYLALPLRFPSSLREEPFNAGTDVITEHPDIDPEKPAGTAQVSNRAVGRHEDELIESLAGPLSIEPVGPKVQKRTPKCPRVRAT